MWNIRLWGETRAIHTERSWRGFKLADAADELLIMETHAKTHGTFKAATRTAEGTTTLVAAPIGGSIVLTDMLISGEKQAGSAVEVRFTDGSNTVTVFLISQVDTPANIAIPFAGRWQGWQDAQIDMITTGTADASVSIGYVKLDNGLAFAEWNAFR